MQDFEERGIGRFSRHRNRQPHHHPLHQQTYRSTGMGGWERHYTGLSDSDLTMHSLEPRLRPKHSLSPDKDFMGDFGDSDMESVVSVTSSAFSTQSERPRGSRGLRYAHSISTFNFQFQWKFFQFLQHQSFNNLFFLTKIIHCLYFLLVFDMCVIDI